MFICDECGQRYGTTRSLYQNDYKIDFCEICGKEKMVVPSDRYGILHPSYMKNRVEIVYVSDGNIKRNRCMTIHKSKDCVHGKNLNAVAKNTLGVTKRCRYCN